ncbi:hypothetical protein BV25DRAFT_424390 [Artomyces pyxidatus]|uniref:Uncharacterized protein n=1 Tax=Artomyces pyxidatus TaxID=48021 RepID=A0ACB8T3R5_9AGAM|nr:hypothetical protein BV25DRAFT_424390 [Artomyces pyxidatus]
MSKSRSASLMKGCKSPAEVKMDDMLPVGSSLDSPLKEEDPSPCKTEPTPPLPAKHEPSPPVPAKPVPKGPQLIGHLPRAEADAMKTFVEIPANHYQYGTLGRSREALESMTCECSYTHGVDSPEDACGEDCINRLTQVECLPEDCRCRKYCQNQRFQRREYSPIEIVQTEKKGFGLRAGQDLRDAFIYEYVGDVVSNPSFVKRMREYAEEGIRHFYFMMLQKDEFIDATKRGGIGRFANHSCNPNCYVAKWTVGQHVRMGIFANRNIKKHEELTFNYNVDRYGHEAQPCYCGEAKCVGYIGGKTQTELAGMDDLYLDALGITDEVDRLGLKGSKKKKSKKLDEDWTPILKPIIEKDVPKVIQAMRQTQSRKVLLKLLMRIKMTEDQSPLRQMMRLRGFSLMTNVMDDYSRDTEILLLAIQCMANWPLISRNKVEDSKVNIPVELCAESENEVLKTAAQNLLDHWATLETAYRIPKRLKGNGEEEDTPTTSTLYSPAEPEYRAVKRSKLEDLIEVKLDIKPLGFKAYRPPPVPPPVQDPPPSSYPHIEPEHIVMQRVMQRPPLPVKFDPAQAKADAAAVIAAAVAAEKAEQARAEAAAAAAADELAKDELKKEEREQRERRRKDRKDREKRKKEREANKEKRLLKLLGAVVVKAMSKYRARFEVDAFKKHAKELTHIIAEKEKKSSSYKDSKLEALSEEKTAKVKKYAREYIQKVIHKLEKAGKLRKPDSSSSSSGAVGAHREEEDGGMAMTVEEAMDLSDDEPDHGHDDRDDGHDDPDDDGHDDEDEGGEGGAQDERTPVEPAESDASTAVVSDPRVRAWGDAKKGLEEPGWDVRVAIDDMDVS